MKENKTIKITNEAHNVLKKHCDKNFLKMSEWLSDVIMKYIGEINNDK